jgi:SAM-dependent methyltransferase
VPAAQRRDRSQHRGARVNPNDPAGHDQIETQREFYGSREHAHLRPQSDDLYANKLARELASRAGISSRSRVLEVGAGFGRFTFPLLEYCGQVVAMDLSHRVLTDLEEARDELAIDPERCKSWCAEAVHGDLSGESAGFDFVVGFFVLHHLPDVHAAILNLAPLVKPGGSLVFLEPNRRNPLFLAQVMGCPDMTWKDEKGMFTLSRRQVFRSFDVAGLSVRKLETFGFFPPQLYNNVAAARRLEAWLEGWRSIASLLPFRLLAATRSARS